MSFNAINSKADKVDGAVAGNVPILNAEGNLVDSGQAISDLGGGGGGSGDVNPTPNTLVERDDAGGINAISLNVNDGAILLRENGSVSLANGLVTINDSGVMTGTNSHWTLGDDGSASFADGGFEISDSGEVSGGTASFSNYITAGPSDYLVSAGGFGLSMYSLDIGSSGGTAWSFDSFGNGTLAGGLTTFDQFGGASFANGATTISLSGVITGVGSGLTSLNASSLSSGTVGTARLGSGTANSSSYLRGDSTWQLLSGLTSSLNASNLTSGTVPDARFPSTLPALSGANLTALNASNLASGTIPSGRFPATLPALSGVNLTALNATQLTSGTVPVARLSASSGSAPGTMSTANYNLVNSATSNSTGNSLVERDPQGSAAFNSVDASNGNFFSGLFSYGATNFSGLTFGNYDGARSMLMTADGSSATLRFRINDYDTGLDDTAQLQFLDNGNYTNNFNLLMKTGGSFDNSLVAALSIDGDTLNTNLAGGLSIGGGAVQFDAGGNATYYATADFEYAIYSYGGAFFNNGLTVGSTYLQNESAYIEGNTSFNGTVDIDGILHSNDGTSWSLTNDVQQFTAVVTPLINGVSTKQFSNAGQRYSQINFGGF